jgi:hypothetical protein
MDRNPSDLVIDEIRAIRRRISARFDHDPARLVAHYIEMQEESRDRLAGGPGTVGESERDAGPRPPTSGPEPTVIPPDTEAGRS